MDKTRVTREGAGAEEIVQGCEHAELSHPETGIRMRIHACRDCIGRGIRAASSAATEKERERCAKIADPPNPMPTDEAALAGMDSVEYGYRSACTDIARTIRLGVDEPIRGDEQEGAPPRRTDGAE